MTEEGYSFSALSGWEEKDRGIEQPLSLSIYQSAP